MVVAENLYYFLQMKAVSRKSCDVYKSAVVRDLLNNF